MQGDPERARSYYRESLILCKEMANKMIASESLDGLACICVAEGATERATRLFGAAEALREAVGGQHTPEEAALREPGLATARSGLDEASWEEAWADRSPSLTRREKEVAILVGRGLTNRQIASEHFLSEHTVHHHVTNILKKLNLSSRQQVVSRLPDR